MLCWNFTISCFPMHFRDVKLNQLAPDEVEQLWAPKLDFYNALGDQTSKVDENTKALVVMEGESLENDFEYAYESKEIKEDIK